MLTATYSLVALTAEQKNARRLLSRLQQQIQGIVRDLQDINRACIERALGQLEAFETYYHRRKVEMYLIPAIRKTTREADPILAELESLSSVAVDVLHSVQDQVRHAFDKGSNEVKKLCSAMEQYCHNLLQRLAKEEQELLPMVKHLLSVEDWFEIAAKFLSHDASAKHQQSRLAMIDG